MESRFLLLLLLISDKRKPGLSEKGKELLKKGLLDKLSKEDMKNLKPKDLANITRDKLEHAGKDLVKNLTKLIKKGGKKDVEKLANKLNCTQIRYMLNDTGKWNCAVLKGLVPAVEMCKKAYAMNMKNMSSMLNLEPLARCGFLKDLDESDFKDLVKKGAFKDASKDTKKALGKKAKDYYGEPEKWSKETLDDMKDILDEVPLKDLKKVPKHEVKDFLKKGAGKKFDKQKKSDIFRHLFKGKRNLTMENITWVCEAGFESELRPEDVKDLPEATLKMHAKCFGRAHSSVRKAFTKRVCSMAMMFDNYTAKACVHSLADMKPSILKNETIAELLLEQYLKLSDKKKPALKPEVCRKLAKAFKKMHMKNPKLKAGPLVKCMNRTADDIVNDKDSLKEIAKSKKNKALRREVLQKLLANKTKYGEKILEFVEEMNIEEMRGFDFAKQLGLGDDDDDDDDDDDEDETLEDDESKGTCEDEDDDDSDDSDDDDDDDSDDDDDDDSDDDDDDDDDNDDDDDDDAEKVTFCDPGKRFIVVNGIGRISDLTVSKIVKIARRLIHGGFTVSNIDDLDDDEFATFAAILSKRENVFSMRQAAKIVKKYKMLYRNSSDAVDDMDGMIAFLNKTDLDSVLSQKCDEVIMKLRESGFLVRMATKVQKEHLKNIVSKCVAGNIEDMSDDHFVNLGHLITLLDPSQFDEIPDRLFMDNLDDFRDNLEEQMQQKGFEDRIKNITKKCVKALRGPGELSADDVARLGVLRKGLDKDDVKDMKPEAQAELEAYNDDLDEEAAKQLFKSRRGGGGSRRKRSTTDYSIQDADFFLNLGQTILGLPASEITNIQNTVFEDIVGTVSQISGWEQGQLEKWADKAEAVWGSPSTFTTDELLLLNNFAKGFTATELHSMDFTSNDVIESFGSVSGFTGEQAKQILAKIELNSPVNSMTGADLLRLGSIALGMSVDDINSITTDAFKTAFSQFGEMTGWSEEQLVALKNKAVAAYGQTSDWDGGILSTANVIIGGFSDSEVRSLESEDLQFISSEAIQALPPSKFSQLSADLIGELDSEQAQSVTDAQISELSASQKNALAGAGSGGTGGGDGDGDGSGNNTGSTTVEPSGSKQSVFGAISLLLPLLCSQLLF